jgi:hypothetical protein
LSSEYQILTMLWNPIVPQIEVWNSNTAIDDLVASTSIKVSLVAQQPDNFKWRKWFDLNPQVIGSAVQSANYLIRLLPGSRHTWQCVIISAWFSLLSLSLSLFTPRVGLS